MKKILFWDRDYATLYAKSDKFKGIYVALGGNNKKSMQSLGLNVVGCFEEDFDKLSPAPIPDNFLIFSLSADRFLNSRFSYEERLVILGKEITFWTHILDEQMPDLIVNEVCTIEFIEVLYILAQKRNIPYHTFLYGQYPGHFSWLDTPFDSEICAERMKDVIVTDEVRDYSNQYIRGVKNKQAKPYYITGLSKNKFYLFLSGLHALLSVEMKASHNGSHFYYEDYRHIWQLWLSARWRLLLAKYNQISELKGKKYIFFPLHYIPEATLSYFAEFYSNQAFVIENIAKSLPVGEVLVVKEHPQQRGVLFTEEYRRVKKTNSNVFYISGDVDSMDVTNGCECIVTITGTAGFEGIILGKPVITLGHVFYNACTEVTHASSFNDLKCILRNHTYSDPDHNKVRQFVEKFFALQKEGIPFLTENGEIQKPGFDEFVKSIEDLL